MAIKIVTGTTTNTQMTVIIIINPLTIPMIRETPTLVIMNGITKTIGITILTIIIITEFPVQELIL